MSIEYVVREARPADCESILALITELAVYEKMPDQVELTADQLREDGFGQGHAPRFQALVVEKVDNKQIIAFSIFIDKYSTWKGRFLWIEDLYVSNAYRRLGVGEAMVRKLAKRAKEAAMPRIEWNVLAWNQLAIDFYKKKLGAIDLTESEQWHVFRFPRPTYEQFLASEFEFANKISIE